MSEVNSQITDSVSQVNMMVNGSSATQALGMTNITGAETMGMSLFNAITAQQNAQTSSSAATTASCAKMLQTPTPVAQVMSDKDKLAYDLLKIESVEQKVALTLAVSVMYGALKSLDPDSQLTLAEVEAALNKLLIGAVKAQSAPNADVEKLTNAVQLLANEIGSMAKILMAIDAAKSVKK
jgi:hypothetical protein